MENHITHGEQRKHLERSVKGWEYWLYPQLKRFEYRDRVEVLSRARHYSLDTIETFGVAIALILVVVAITKSSVVALERRAASKALSFILFSQYHCGSSSLGHFTTVECAAV